MWFTGDARFGAIEAAENDTGDAGYPKFVNYLTKSTNRKIFQPVCRRKSFVDGVGGG